ncbi:hypothetical protein [uncultured Pseudoflavonifractor sp.]|uniref:hypothetical protein n=1 Tax=uncultured Pseudoflavonifractor sp. TaxID=1221379 RepID=UPI0025D5B70B|nr:hypothetical protein [uncultured Pseudoflavonifractor sp.]
MKPLLTILLSVLLLLSACAGEASVSPSPSQPASGSTAPPPAASPSASPDAPAWWENIPTGNLPDTLSAAEDVEAGSGGLYRLAELADQDIVLYGYGGEDDGAPFGVLLANGNTITPFDQVYLSAEHPMLPQLRWEDLDGDGSKELAVVYLVSNSSDGSVFELHVYQPQPDGGWNDCGLLPDYYVPLLEDLLSFSYDHEENNVTITAGTEKISVWYDGPSEPDGLATVGNLVFFRWEDGAYTAVFGLQITAGDASCTDIGSLTAQVIYDGGALTLAGFQLNAIGGV